MPSRLSPENGKVAAPTRIAKVRSRGDPFFTVFFFFGEGRSVDGGGGHETVSNRLNGTARGGFRCLQKMALHEEQRKLRASIFFCAVASAEQTFFFCFVMSLASLAQAPCLTGACLSEPCPNPTWLVGTPGAPSRLRCHLSCLLFFCSSLVFLRAPKPSHSTALPSTQ